jgi:hypothetical protein
VLNRPIGVLALAILTFLQGLYMVYVTLIYLGWVSFELLGRTVRLPEAAWGQAILAGVLAAMYLAVSVGFWRVRAWAWIYGLLISGFNLFWLLISVLGPHVTLEAVIVPVLLNLAVLAYLYWPGTREAVYRSELGREG